MLPPNHVSLVSVTNGKRSQKQRLI